MATYEYVDFNLAFDQVQQDSYRVKADCDLSGEASGTSQMPLTEDEVREFIQEMGFHRSEDQQVLKAITDRERSARTLGQRLFETGLPTPVRERLLSALTRFHAGEAPGIRLKLHLTRAPELADLPWEFLYPGDDYDFPALSTRTPIVRYPELPRPVLPLKVTLPLQILALVVRPVGYLVPDPDREREALNRSLASLIAKHQIQVTWLVNPNWEQLQRQLRLKAYHILHFVGHGIFDPKTQDGFLILTDERGYEDRLDSVRLRRLLGDCPDLRLAVLVACEGARTGKVDPFAGIAATLVRGGIPAVVAMQFPITYGAAAVFEAALYQALADKLPIDAAVGEGRKAVDLKRMGTVEWGIPVLYMRSPKGDIFDVTAVVPRLQLRSPELDERYSQALRHYYDQQMEQARIFLEEIVAEAPDYPGAYEKLEIARQVAALENEARLLQQAGRWKEVLAVLDRVQSLIPNYSDPHGHLAWAEEERRRDVPNMLYRRGLSGLLLEEQAELARIDGEHGLRHLAKELADSGRWETLYRLVAEGDESQPWAEARREMEGSYAGYLSDLRLAWRHAEGVGQEQARCQEPITTIGEQVRYATITSSIHLLLSGTSPRYRCESLSLVVNALAALGPSLSAYPDLLAQAVDLACAIGDVESRDQIRSVSGQYYNGYPISETLGDSLIALAPSLAQHPNLVMQALDAACSIGDGGKRSQALAALAPLLTEQPNLLAQTLDTAGSLSSSADCSRVLVALAPSLAGHPALLFQAAAIARNIRDDDDRSRALIAMASYVPADLRLEVLTQALEAARNIRNDYGSYGSSCSEALVTLAPSLVEYPDLLSQALEAARNINGESSRSEALAALAPYLSEDLRREVLTQALQAARNINGESSRSEVFVALAPLLAEYPDLLSQALETVRNINDESPRPEALAALAPYLSEDLRREVLIQALEAARNIGDDYDFYGSRSEALVTLAPSLAEYPDLLSQALEAARGMLDRSSCLVLVALAPHLVHYPDLKERLCSYWSEMMRAISADPFYDFCSLLAERSPLLIVLGGDRAAAEAARAILDAYEWWLRSGSPEIQMTTTYHSETKIP